MFISTVCLTHKVWPLFLVVPGEAPGEVPPVCGTVVVGCVPNNETVLVLKGENSISTKRGIKYRIPVDNYQIERALEWPRRGEGGQSGLWPLGRAAGGGGGRRDCRQEEQEWYFPLHCSLIEC